MKNIKKLAYFATARLVFEKSDMGDQESEQKNALSEIPKPLASAEKEGKADDIHERQTFVQKHVESAMEVDENRNHPILKRGGKYASAHERYLSARGMGIENKLGATTRIFAEEFHVAGKRDKRRKDLEKIISDLKALPIDSSGYTKFVSNLTAMGEDASKIELDYSEVLLKGDNNKKKLKRKVIEDHFGQITGIKDFLDFIESKIELLNAERELEILQAQDSLVDEIIEAEAQSGTLEQRIIRITALIKVFNGKYKFGKGPEHIIRNLGIGIGSVVVNNKGVTVYVSPEDANKTPPEDLFSVSDFDSAFDEIIKSRKEAVKMPIPRPAPGSTRRAWISKNLPSLLQSSLRPDPPRPNPLSIGTRRTIVKAFRDIVEKSISEKPLKSKIDVDLMSEIESRILDGRIRRVSEAKAMIELFQAIETKNHQSQLIINHFSDIPPEHMTNFLAGDMEHSKLQFFDILIDDVDRKLSRDQVKLLVEGLVNPDAVRFIEANLDHPEMTTEYIQQIIDVERPTTFRSVDGRLLAFYDPPHITDGPSRTLLGKGGIGTIYKAFLFEPGSYKATYSALKKAGSLYQELANAERLMQFAGDGNKIDGIVEPLAVGAVNDEDIIFYEVVQFPESITDVHEQTVTKMKSTDLEKLTLDPDVSAEELLTLLTQATDADLQLRDHGIVDLDTKLENIMKAERGGVKIDVGSHSVLNDVKKMIFYPDPITIHSDTREDMRMDESTGQEVPVRIDEFCYIGHKSNIGVTPGYYSEDILRGVRNGDLNITAIHNYIYGVMLHQIVGGELPYRKVVSVDDGPLTYTNHNNVRDNYIFEDTGVIHNFSDQNINTQIIAWAWALMDPQSGVDAAYVNAEIKKVLQNQKSSI